MSDGISRRLRKACLLRQLAARTEFEAVARRLLARALRLEADARKLVALQVGP